MKRISQGGSTASFIIVGVVLVVAISSLVYFAVQRGRQARIDQATTIAVQQAKDTKSAEKAASTPAETTTPPQANPSSTESEVVTTQSNDLPHTGPQDGVGGMIGLALLTMTGVSFVRSRHAASRVL